MRLMRIDWATVGRMVEGLVAEASAAGEDWLAGLRRIGIDEVSYRKGPPRLRQDPGRPTHMNARRARPRA